MARHESDREELMAEATALRERIELALPDQGELIVVGFRDDGRWSVYFGSDPVLHFDAAGCVRRAFAEGALYRSQSHTLARLVRTRAAGKTALVRNDLERAQLLELLAQWTRRVEPLSVALHQGTARVVRQIPEDGDLRPRVLEALAAAIPLRLSPRFTKR